MTMRQLGEPKLTLIWNEAGEAVRGGVKRRAYQLEGLGVHLFERD